MTTKEQEITFKLRYDGTNYYISTVWNPTYEYLTSEPRSQPEIIMGNIALKLDHAARDLLTDQEQQP